MTRGDAVDDRRAEAGATSPPSSSADSATWQQLIAVLPEGVLLVGASGIICAANAEAERVFGAAPGELTGKNVDELVPTPRRAAHASLRESFDAGTHPPIMNAGRMIDGVRLDGSTLRLEVALGPLPAGAPGTTLALVRDVSRREQAAAEARVCAAALAATANAVMISDASGRVVSVNAAFSKLTGWSADEVIGRTPSFLKSGQMPEAYYERLWSTILAGQPFSSEVVNRRKDGALYVEEQTITPVPGPDGRPSHFIAIRQDVTRRHEDQEAMRAAKLAAEEATLAKSRFLATMSHEIRTPMNAIIGVTELLLDATLDERQRELLETLRNSGEGLLTLLDEILDFSKVEAGRVELVKRPFDPVATLEGRISLLAPRAEARGIELSCRVSPEVPSLLLGDELRFSQIILNLVGNALKFTEEGSVTVTLDPAPLAEGSDEDRAGAATFRGVVTIRDTGIGIPKEQVDRLFQSFVQGDSSSSRRFKGTGLGLAISRRLATLMGGSIEVESEGVPGRGSTFRFLFDAELVRGSHAGEQHAAWEDKLRGVRALVVGDHPAGTLTLAEQLRAWGMEVDVIPDPSDARAFFARGGRPALVVAATSSRGHDPAAFSAPIQQAWKDQGTPRGLPVVLLCAASQRPALDPRAAAAPHGALVTVLTWPPRSRSLRRAIAAALGDQAPPSSLRAHPLAPRAEHVPPLNILIVEDDEVNQMVLRGMLLGFGLRAELAIDGAEALEATKRRDFDLIFMDMQLPGMDGPDTTRRMRERDREEGRRAPRIIAVTANAFDEDRRRCLSAGMDDFLAKPLRKNDLLEALRRSEQALAERAAPSTSEAERAPPEPDPPPDAALLDPSVLAELLEAMGGAPESLSGLLDTLLANAAALVDTIEQAQASGDRVELRRAAHSLKSNARIFGLGPLGELSATIESLASGETAGDSEPPVRRVRSLFDRSRAVLVAHVRGHDQR
jgi:PAS domain S-box-containing protein